MDAVHKSGTNKKYKRALNLFLNYCNCVGDIIGGVDDLDEVLCEYIEYLHASGGKLYQASDTVYALQFYYPKCKHWLLTAKLLLRGWNNIQQKQYRPPLTWELTVVLAVSMAKASHIAAAVATLLSFDCYLRIGECLNLTVADVAVGGNMHFGSAYTGMAVGLKHTKTGVNQFVKVREKAVEALLLLLIAGTWNGGVKFPLTAKLFPYTPAAYRSIFKSACVSIGVGGVGFVPHSLRHGGATRDFLLTVPLEDILIRGRWAVSKSARIYIQSGQALLITVRAPALQKLGADIVASGDLVTFFEQI